MGESRGPTGHMLLALAAFALFMTILGIVVVWAMSYGPL